MNYVYINIPSITKWYKMIFRKRLAVISGTPVYTQQCCVGRVGERQKWCVCMFRSHQRATLNLWHNQSISQENVNARPEIYPFCLASERGKLPPSSQAIIPHRSVSCTPPSTCRGGVRSGGRQLPERKTEINFAEGKSIKIFCFNELFPPSWSPPCADDDSVTKVNKRNAIFALNENVKMELNFSMLNYS